MTIPEITAYVMGLPVEDLRRLSATDVMGWVEGTYPAPGDVARWQVNQKDGIGGIYVKWDSWEDEYGEFIMYRKNWCPDEDRNQSRMVTDKVSSTCDGNGVLTSALKMVYGIRPNQPVIFDWFSITPDHETRAALIAHMIHTQEAANDRQ